MTALLATTWTLSVAGSLLIVLLRITSLDERWVPAVRLASFTRAVQALSLLPALLLTLLRAVGVVPRTWSPAGWIAFGVTMVASAVATWPLRPRSTPRPAGTAGVRLLLGSLNVERDTLAAGRIASRLIALDCDVLLLQEYTAATAAACRTSGLLAAYPHHCEHPQEGWFGSALLSRYPIDESRLTQVGHRPMTTSTLLVGDGQLTIVNVHMQAPIHAHDMVPWRDAFADLGAIAKRRGSALVLVGDWNATLSHAPMRRLLRSNDVVDAHLASGRRWVPTWPVGRRHPPLLGLDHCLVSPDVGVEATSEYTFEGTDHRAVTAALRLP